MSARVFSCSNWLLCVLLLLPSLAPVHAQPLGGFDVEPPLIEHEVVDRADAAYRQSFVAQVVDDTALDSVTLHWRFAGESAYARLAMSPVSTSSTWIAQVPTRTDETRAIEYYLEARDTGGNRTVRGFVFSPLVRVIVPPGGEVASPTGSEPPPATRSRTVYYVLGALALGLLVGIASSDGGSSESTPSECGDDGCDVVITFQSPVVQ